MPDTDRLINKDQGDSIISAIQGITARLQEMYTVDDALSSTSENPVQNKVVKDALDGKVDKVSGKGLSTNDYTTADKEKLAGIEAGAQVNTVVPEDIESTQTATGNPLTLTDCAPINAESLVVELQPKQDLHGYQYPWVGGAGKNKFNSDALSNFTKSGDEYIGKSSYWYTDLNNNEPYSGGFKANTQYTFSVIAKNDSNYGGATGFRFYYTDNTYDQVYFSDNVYKYYTITSAIGKTVDRISAPYNYQVDLYIKECQLEEGTQATPFAPWENKCPITGYTQTSVEGTGINIWDEEWENGGIDYNTGNNTQEADRIRSKNFISVLPNNEYFIKSSGHTTALRFYDVNKNYISYGAAYNTDRTFTPPSNCMYLKFIILETTYNNDISINYPSTDHDYHAYASTSATIQFGQTVYGAEVDFSGGTDDEWAKYDTWDTSWYKSSTEATILSKSFSDKKSGVNEIKCNAYKYEANQGFNLSYGAISNSGVADYRQAVFIRDSRFAGKTVEECVAILNDEGTYFVYQLETPNEISTPPSPLKLLKGTNNLSADGNMELGYQPDNVIGELKGMIQDLWDYVLTH